MEGLGWLDGLAASWVERPWKASQPKPAVRLWRAERRETGRGKGGVCIGKRVVVEVVVEII